jgi:hypothetical protein
MNRRNFLKGLAVTAAGIAIPEIILPPEPEKRFWSLDRTMMHTPITYKDYMYLSHEVESRFIERWAPHTTIIYPVSRMDGDTELVTFHGFDENGEMILQQNARIASSEIESWVQWGITNQQS